MEHTIPAAQAATREDHRPTVVTNWTEQAITEAKSILTQPVKVTGWDGIGYSVVVAEEDRCPSFFGLRGCDWTADLLRVIHSHKDHLPLVRYYASYGGADELKNEVWRLQRGGVIVAAQIGFRGFADGRPAPTVQQIVSCDLTMVMVKDVCQHIADVGQRYRHLASLS